MAPKRRCPVCGSKQWHKEPSSGLIACSEGHILQNYRNEATEAEDMGQHTLRKRTLRSGKKAKEKLSKANPELYHGVQGRYLYFQCQQIILRKQIAALTRLWHLPPEFEMVCRDIWTLHLSMLSDPVPEDPSMDLNSEVKKDAEQSTSNSNARPGSSSSSSSSSDEESDDEKRKGIDKEKDPEMAELLRQNSETSSQEESEEDEQPIARSSKTAKIKGHNVHEGPAMNLAVLMVALWTMKIPVLYRDFTRHIEMYELPYLDPVRLLPREMVLHLTKHNKQALSPAHAPDTINLHKLTSRLAKRLYQMYGVLTPEANAAPMLWRVIQGLGGTPLLYRLTKRLSHILSLPLALHYTLVPGLRQIKQKDPEHHKYDNAPVEASFLAATIVMLKLVYGLDGKARMPTDAADPACALPRISDYLETVKRLQETDLNKDAVFNSESWTSMDKLDDATMDAYLSFCERVLVGSDAEEHKILTEFFPVTKSVHVGHDETATEGPQRCVANGLADDDDDTLRPGEGYRIYGSRDVLGSEPEELGRVVERGCGWGGIGKEYMYGLVEKYERRLVRRLKGSGPK